MISYSESNNSISQNQNNPSSDDNNHYENKISAIWNNIQKTRQIQASDDDETYQMYKSKRISSRRQSRDQYPEQLQQKILNKLKPKKTPNPQVQQKLNYLRQRNESGPSQNQKNNLSRKSMKHNSDLQQKLEKSKHNTNILMKKLIQAEQQIEYLQYELERQITEKENLLFQFQTRSQQVNRDQKQNRVINSNRTDKSILQSQITIDKYRLKLKAAQKQLSQKNSQLAQLQNQIRTISGQLQDYKMKNIQPSIQNVAFKGSQLLQLNQAYKTIQRLVSLVKSTQQYRLLGNFAEEVKTIHFLSKIPKQIKSQLAAIKISSKTKEKSPTCQHCTQIKINQRLLWTPLLCYKKMLEMKMKHDTLNEDCIEEVLFEMNKLYLSKQETRVSKLKASYQTEIQKLKKKTQLTYDQILAKKQIQRLKKQLQTSKHKHGKVSSRKESDPNFEQKLRKYNNPSNLQNLRAIGQYEDELRLKGKEIKLLIERINLLESETSSYDKSLYMEGVLWIIDKILQELDTNAEDIREFQNKFRAKIDSASSTEDWIRLFKQFFQSMEQLNHAIIEKILNIKQSTITKMNYAS